MFDLVESSKKLNEIDERFCSQAEMHKKLHPGQGETEAMQDHRWLIMLGEDLIAKMSLIRRRAELQQDGLPETIEDVVGYAKEVVIRWLESDNEVGKGLALALTRLACSVADARAEYGK